MAMDTPYSRQAIGQTWGSRVEHAKSSASQDVPQHGVLGTELP